MACVALPSSPDLSDCMATAVALVDNVFPQLGQSKQLAHLGHTRNCTVFDPINSLFNFRDPIGGP